MPAIMLINATLAALVTVSLLALLAWGIAADKRAHATRPAPSARGRRPAAIRVTYVPVA